MPQASDLCTLVQQDLNNIAGTNSATGRRTQVGFLDAILSERNTAGFEVIAVDNGDGKKKKVKVRYMQPINDTDTSTTKANACTSELEVLPLEDEIECTSHLRMKNLKFSKASMRTFCESPSEYRGQVFANALNAYMIALNKKLIAQYVAKKGNFVDGTTTFKSIPLLNQGTGGVHSADFWGESLMAEEFIALEGSDMPIAVGAGVLSHYARLQEIGCCNQYGQQVDEFGSSFSFYRDKYVDAIAGEADSILAWNAGAFQLITSQENKGEFRDVANPHHQEFTIVDPFTGLELDVFLHYIECDQEWVMQFSTCYDLIPIIRDDSYPAGHELEDTNGGLMFKGTIS